MSRGFADLALEIFSQHHPRHHNSSIFLFSICSNCLSFIPPRRRGHRACEGRFFSVFRSAGQTRPGSVGVLRFIRRPTHHGPDLVHSTSGAFILIEDFLSYLYSSLCWSSCYLLFRLVGGRSSRHPSPHSPSDFHQKRYPCIKSRLPRSFLHIYSSYICPLWSQTSPDHSLTGFVAPTACLDQQC